MSKLIILSTVLIVAAVAVAIASLVLNIVILTNTNSIINTTPSDVVHEFITYKTYCNAPDCKVSNASGWQEAGQRLLQGLDMNIDPCEDFYAFTCNKYLGQIDLKALGVSRKGTYADSQINVNAQIASALSKVNAKSSLTERITQTALNSCVKAANSDLPNLNKRIGEDIRKIFTGIPFLNEKLGKDLNLFSAAGKIEQQHALGTLFFSWSTVDYKNISQNALYISQPSLSLPLDYYVKPQFMDKLTARKDSILSTMKQFAIDSQVKANLNLEDAAEKVTQFEVLIALASWPDDLLRNYRLQYNKFFLKTLNTSYPSVDWLAYMSGLLNGVQNAAQIATDGVVLSQPSYFSWLESVFAGNLVDKETISNYMIVNWLMDDAGFWGPMQKVVREANYVPYVYRKGNGARKIGRRYERRFDNDGVSNVCLDLIMAYMPYGPGYVYVQSIDNRKAMVADVTRQTTMIIDAFKGMIKSLAWMTSTAKQNAFDKAANLFKNYGYPSANFLDFDNITKVDAYHQDYVDILKYGENDFYDILLVLKRGMEVREAFRLLSEPANRYNFLQSPAMVNAWYQPERNSITFPIAAWNPPYYSLNYPQAYNFAGQGGTGGHELTHGYDDEGVQFGPTGALMPCSWNRCGWMDDQSSDGFTDMAQCVVSQFNTQCCPVQTGNVHCVDGSTTQGENIADLGGQQAAYYAYMQYISEVNKGVVENRIPGMEQFSPNQIFWITYGYSWCMKQTTESLVNQLLTNPHSPAQCRTNQVMQDIPAFGSDFNCRRGSPMYPTDDKRCKVWVGF
ncbi:unnamed protein product [Auanema sp. JU1783]|nr:unnamed protein product [Auanema sp. JU1783]